MLRIGFAISSLLFSLCGCRKPVDRAPDSFTLTLSSGGGFAGSYQGYTLASNGDVTAWSGGAAGQRTDLWTRKAAPESLAAFARVLDGFTGTGLSQTGNMTTRIEYASPRGDHQWSIAGAGAAPDAPEPFRTWYARVEAYCRNLAPEARP